MPEVNIKLENKLLSTFAEILELKINEKIIISLKDEDIVLQRVKHEN